MTRLDLGPFFLKYRKFLYRIFNVSMGMGQYHHALPYLAYHEYRGKVRQVLRKNPYNSNYNFSIEKSEKQSLKTTRIEQILEFRDKTRNLLTWNIFTVKSNIFTVKSNRQKSLLKLWDPSRNNIVVLMKSVFYVNNLTPSIKYLVCDYSHKKHTSLIIIFIN